MSHSADPQQYLANLGNKTALGRIARSEEIAQAVLFLASDDSSFVTGSVPVVDGGWTAG